MWIWIAVVVLALIILGVAGVKLLGRLDGLRRAAARLQRRQEDAAKLQVALAALQETVETVQQQVAALEPRR
ncbi:MAG: hypothetical protein ABW046_14990 [Actinoplanes sp.]